MLYGTSQITSIGGSTYLVKYDTQFLALTAQTKHRLHKVIAKRTVEPCRAYDYSLGMYRQNGLLASQFRSTIYRVGACGLIFLVGHVVLTIEYIVCRHMYKPYLMLSCDTCEIGRSQMVELVAQLGILLGLVDIGIGSTVDNAVDSMVYDIAFYSFDVADIQFGHIGKVIRQLLLLSRYHTHLIAKLPVGSRNKYIFHLTRNNLSIIYYG